MTEQALGPVRTASTASVHPTPAWAQARKSLLLPAFWVVVVLTRARRGAGGRVRR